MRRIGWCCRMDISDYKVSILPRVERDVVVAAYPTLEWGGRYRKEAKHVAGFSRQYITERDYDGDGADFRNGR